MVLTNCIVNICCKVILETQHEILQSHVACLKHIMSVQHCINVKYPNTKEPADIKRYICYDFLNENRPRRLSVNF